MTTFAVRTELYTHLEIGKEVPFGIAGYYTPFKEVRLPFKGRELLYVVGKAVIESSCCGAEGTWVYATVPGYIRQWHGFTKNGLPASEVEAVSDPAEQQELVKIIESQETVDLVHFA